MRLTRVIARLEPGGEQLGILRITAPLRELGFETRLVAAHASRDARRPFAAAGFPIEVWRSGDERVLREPRAAFADWLAPRVKDAHVVHAHGFGAWWAAARAIGDDAALVASEY